MKVETADPSCVEDVVPVECAAKPKPRPKYPHGSETLICQQYPHTRHPYASPPVRIACSSACTISVVSTAPAMIHILPSRSSSAIESPGFMVKSTSAYPSSAKSFYFGTLAPFEIAPCVWATSVMYRTGDGNQSVEYLNGEIGLMNTSTRNRYLCWW